MRHHPSYLTLLLLWLTLPMMGQADKSQKALLKEVQGSGKYIVGTGHGSTLRQAQESALADLAGQISTTVSSQFEYIMDSKTKGKESEFSQQVNSIVKTYSHTSLRGALEIVVKDEPDATVVRYIKADDIEKVFESRREKAMTFARNAERYEKDGKVGDALSYYYWSLALLRSCPSGNEMKITLGLNEEQLLINYIYNKLKEILQNTQVSVASNTLEEDGTRTLGLHVDYKGQPAVNFNYTYFNGERRSELNSLQNGNDAIFLPASLNLSKLDIRAEYSCEEEANMDSELRDVLMNTPQVPLAMAKMQLQGVKEVATKKAQDTQESLQLAKGDPQPTDIRPNATMVKYLNEAEAVPFLATISKVEKALRNKDYSGVQQYFTPEGYDMFQKLINYGNARLIRTPDVRFSRFGSEVTCRSFPMSFSFKTNRRTFSENVIFRLNDDALITEVAFGLEERATNDILNNSAKRYSEDARKVLVSFLESYKTAYALRRLDYLDKIFSNDALIITGSVVSSAGFGELKPKQLQHVKYTRQTKAQYLKNLQRTMMSNEFINIHFAENTVKKSTGKEIYGIQIKQDYFSSSYGDTGYLFLLLDLTEPKQPTVKVRAWQPDLDPTIPDGRLDISDFIF